MVFEKVFDAFAEIARTALAFPELRSVAVVADWEVGAGEFPYAIMIGRQGAVRRPNELMGLSRQTLKLVSEQFSQMSELLQGADELAERLAQEIKTREQTLKDLDAAIAGRNQQLGELRNRVASAGGAAASFTPAAPAPGPVPDPVRTTPPDAKAGG